MRVTELSIGGRACCSAGGATFERCNPGSGLPVTRAAAAGATDAIAAASAAARALPAWSGKGPGERRRILLRAADLMEVRANAFVDSMMEETGATRIWSMHNVEAAAGILREAASMTTQIGGEIIPSDKPGCLSIAVREPVGVVAGIAPWNAPVILGTRAIAMALACGNTTVLKASEVCPGTHSLIVEVLCEAGLGDGVVNLITHAPGDAEPVVNALICHDAVRRINFTGSTRVGRLIAAKAATQLKPVLLELGGKSPLLVLDDADIDKAVSAAIFGAFFNQGQICMSTERIVLTPKVAENFSRQFARRATQLSFGDPQLGEFELGTLISHESGDRLAILIEDAVSKGASVLCGGKPSGVLMPATVLDLVTPEMTIYSEESFGPVVCLVRAQDEQDAVAICNDTEYGLAAAIFSRDVGRAMTLARRLNTGSCHINGATVNDEPQVPFGGTRSSGYGRFGGKAGISEFTELRWITVEGGEARFPI